MSKVLFLANHDMAISNTRFEVVEKFLEEGHQVVVSTPYGESIEALKKMGCEYYSIKLDRHGINPIKDLKLIKKYKKLIKEVKPDIVFGFTVKPNLYGAMACKKYKIPFIANITGLGTAVENPGILQKIIVLLYKIAFKKVKKVFFQNTENRQFFIDKKIALGKHELLPGSGVNLQKYLPTEYPTDDVIKFVFISRIMREKGIDEYIEAAKFIKGKYPNTEFHVCGFCEQAYDEQLKELTKRGILNYHGLVNDIRTILKDVHCTVHPTFYPEGLSNVLLESSAMARPIITTDRSGCREVVEEGKNGFIVKQKDAKDLIEKLERFLSLSKEERERMGLYGRKKVEKEFDRKIVVEKYLKEVEDNDK